MRGMQTDVLQRFRTFGARSTKNCSQLKAKSALERRSFNRTHSLLL